MPTIVTFTPLQPPARLAVRTAGRLLTHRCEDVSGHRHSQRLPLGSISGITYLDALCLHCGAHFVWIDDEDDDAGPPTPPAPDRGRTARARQARAPRASRPHREKKSPSGANSS